MHTYYKSGKLCLISDNIERHTYTVSQKESLIAFWTHQKVTGQLQATPGFSIVKQYKMDSNEPLKI